MPVAPDAVQTVTVTLATGKSAAIDVSGVRTIGLVFPAAYDAVVTTFEGSVDGATFFPVQVLQSGAGATVYAPLSLPAGLASKALSIPWELSPFNFIKIVAAVVADRAVLLSAGG